MTQNTASLISSAIQQVSTKLRDGTLERRLCRDCGEVREPWHVCSVAALRAHEIRKESR